MCYKTFSSIAVCFKSVVVRYSDKGKTMNKLLFVKFLCVLVLCAIGSTNKAMDIFQASQVGNCARVGELLDQGVNPNVRNVNGYTPLFIAASNGHYAIVEKLLHVQGINPNIPGLGGRTPLQIAIEREQVAIADALIKSGLVDINVADDQRCTALHYAAARGLTHIVLLLIEHKVFVNASNSKGNTPLHLAAAQSRSDVVHILIDTEGVDVNIADVDGYTPLHKTICMGNLDTINMLLNDTRTQVNTIARGNLTPLLSAVSRGLYGVVEILIARGADVNMRNEVNGHAPLHLAVGKGYGAIASLLVHAPGIKINIMDKFGHTPLMLAAYHGRNDLVTLFLNCGADVMLRSRRGNLSLHKAISQGHIDAVTTLLDRHPALIRETGEQGASPLHEAVKCGNPVMVRFLLLRNVDVNQLDNFGRTARVLAASNNRQDLVGLIDNGEVRAQLLRMATSRLDRIGDAAPAHSIDGFLLKKLKGLLQ